MEKFLPSVMKYSSGARIIIADNASTDDSLDFLMKNYPSIELIRLSTNGFAGGYNEALSQIEADIVVLLNTDVEVRPNWLDPIVKLMSSDKEIAACQPKILSFDDKDRFEYAGAGGGLIDYLGFPFCRGRIFQTLEEDQGQCQTTCSRHQRRDR